MEIDRFAILSLPLVVVHVPTSPSEVTNQVSSLILCVFPLFPWPRSFGLLRSSGSDTIASVCCSVFPIPLNALAQYIQVQAASPPPALPPLLPNWTTLLECLPQAHSSVVLQGSIFSKIGALLATPLFFPWGREAGSDHPLTRFEPTHASN